MLSLHYSLPIFAGTTHTTGVMAAGIALVLALGCLENEQRRGVTLANRALWLLYAPLLVPQVAFLFGAQVLAIQAGIDATWLAMVWSHLLFVLPYVFLTLGDPFRALDARYARTARSEEHTSELQSLMRISYAVFCLKKKKQKNT